MTVYDKIFPTPLPIGWVIFFMVAGISGYWSRWGYERTKIFGLSPIVAMLPCQERTQTAVTFVLFLVVGSIVGLALVRPINVAQSLTAGFAWTGFFATFQEPEVFNRKKRKAKTE
jgi:hypothetical protein